MTKKALCILENEPDLKALDEKLSAISKEELEHIEWFKKRAEEIQTNYNKQREAVWLEIQNTCKARGWLDAHDNCLTGGNIGLSIGNGVLYSKPVETQQNGMPDELKLLLASLLHRD